MGEKNEMSQKMLVYLAVRNEDVAIIKPYFYKPFCEQFIKDWNENETDKLHLESYAIDQVDYWEWKKLNEGKKK